MSFHRPYNFFFNFCFFDLELFYIQRILLSFWKMFYLLLVFFPFLAKGFSYAVLKNVLIFYYFFYHFITKSLNENWVFHFWSGILLEFFPLWGMFSCCHSLEMIWLWNLSLCNFYCSLVYRVIWRFRLSYEDTNKWVSFCAVLFMLWFHCNIVGYMVFSFSAVHCGTNFLIIWLL